MVDYFKKEYCNREGKLIMDYVTVDDLVMQTISGDGDSDCHALIMYALVLSIKAKTIVELGVRNGSSTAPLLLAAQKMGGKLYSVDIKPCLFGVSKDLVPFWEFHKSDALEFLHSWDETKIIDLIFIDDLHTRDHVAAEIQSLKPLITPSSIILLHDTMYNHYQPKYHIDPNATGQWVGGGPAKAVMELDLSVWEFVTIPSCNGLTILRLKVEG